MRDEVGAAGGALALCSSPLVILVANVFDPWVPACPAILAFVVLFVGDTLAPEWFSNVNRARVFVLLQWLLVDMRR